LIPAATIPTTPIPAATPAHTTTVPATTPAAGCYTPSKTTTTKATAETTPTEAAAVDAAAAKTTSPKATTKATTAETAAAKAMGTSRQCLAVHKQSRAECCRGQQYTEAPHHVYLQSAIMLCHCAPVRLAQHLALHPMNNLISTSFMPGK
jgi:hypothetical protein